MTYGKLENEEMVTTEVENGRELSEPFRTEFELKEKGYKPVCYVKAEEGQKRYHWDEYPEIYIQVWEDEQPDSDSEI